MSPFVSDVSIITVNWNGKPHLQRLLPSLTNLGAGEIIVVDNGSRDDSVSFLKRYYPRVRVLENPVNKGFCQPNNWAAEIAGGSILAFINNDMRADAKWLSSALAFFEKGAVCVASRILNWEGDRIDFNGSSLQYLGYALQRDIGKLVSQVTCSDKILFPCGGAMLIDKDVFQRSGGFDEDFFAVYEDVDLGWRLWVQGYEVHFSSESFVYHRSHGTFQAQADEKMRYLMHRNALLTILKNYEEETFHRILPLSLILAVKRAVRLSGVEKESFYLWAQTRRTLEMGDLRMSENLVDSLNHLVCVDDVLDSLPAILRKRKEIQQKRRRSDSEILKLFEDPLRPIVEDGLYVSSELQHLQMLDLSRLFDTTPSDTLLQQVPERLQQKIVQLRGELQALQWLQGHALLHPPPSVPGGKLRKFLQTWRSSGFKRAWRRAVENLSGRH